MQTHTARPHISPLAAGLTGLVLGAAGAAAVALADEETRKKATKKASSLKDDLQKWSTKTLHDLQQRGETLKTVEKKRIEEPKTDVSTTVKETLDDPNHN